MNARINNAVRCLLFAATLAALNAAFSGDAAAADHVWRPDTTSEVYDPSRGFWGIFDDEVQMWSSRQNAITVRPGDTVTWRHSYTENPAGYKVRTTHGGADIDVLQFRSTVNVGGGVKTKIELQLIGSDGRPIGKAYNTTLTWVGRWASINPDDVLGDMSADERCVTGFVIKMTQIKGTVELERIDFTWEDRKVVVCE